MRRGATPPGLLTKRARPRVPFKHSQTFFERHACVGTTSGAQLCAASSSHSSLLRGYIPCNRSMVRSASSYRCSRL